MTTESQETVIFCRKCEYTFLKSTTFNATWKERERGEERGRERERRKGEGRNRRGKMKKGTEKKELKLLSIFEKKKNKNKK